MSMNAVLVDCQAAAVAVGLRPSTIRVWAHRGWIARHGTDPHGRTLYDLADVLDRAQVDGTRASGNTRQQRDRSVSTVG